MKWGIIQPASPHPIMQKAVLLWHCNIHIFLGQELGHPCFIASRGKLVVFRRPCFLPYESTQWCWLAELLCQFLLFRWRMAFLWHWACNCASMTTNKMLYIGTSQWQTKSNQGLKKNVHVTFNRTIRGKEWQQEMWANVYVCVVNLCTILDWHGKDNRLMP